MSSVSSADAIAAQGTQPDPPGVFSATWTIIRKDLLLEWRGRARINATLFFALLTLLIFSFAMGADTKLLQRAAPGFLWMAILLSSTLSLGESMRVERENEALEGLRLLAVNARGIFLGKALVNTAVLVGLGAVLVPVMVALYSTTLTLGVGKMIVALFLGAAAISAPGTLYAAIANHARARDVLLPMLLFPVLIPGLLAAVNATTLILEGDPMVQLNSWLGLLGAFAGIYWVLGGLLFGRVIED